MYIFQVILLNILLATIYFHNWFFRMYLLEAQLQHFAILSQSSSFATTLTAEVLPQLKEEVDRLSSLRKLQVCLQSLFRFTQNNNANVSQDFIFYRYLSRQNVRSCQNVRCLCFRRINQAEEFLHRLAIYHLTQFVLFEERSKIISKCRELCRQKEIHAKHEINIISFFWA